MKLWTPRFFKKNTPFLSPQQIAALQNKVAEAETQTSGEVRIFIEKKCPCSSPLDRAKQIFAKEKMTNTKDRNGVLLYIAHQDRKVAIYGDEGINAKVNDNFWQHNLNELIAYLKTNDREKGIALTIHNIGQKLKDVFPYNALEDKNELPNDLMMSDD